VTASKSLCKQAYLGFWPAAADEFTVYKKGGRPGHAVIQTENAISFSYLPILIRLGNLPSCGGLVHCDQSQCPRPFTKPYWFMYGFWANRQMDRVSDGCVSTSMYCAFLSLNTRATLWCPRRWRQIPSDQMFTHTCHTICILIEWPAWRRPYSD